MKFNFSRVSALGVALTIAISITGCSNNSPTTSEVASSSETMASASELSPKDACSNVDASFENSRKYDARYRNKAATVDEVINAYKAAANAFTSASDRLNDAQNIELKLIFRKIGLAFNQYRVALETNVPMDEQAINDGKSALEQFFALCNKSSDFEST